MNVRDGEWSGQAVLITGGGGGLGRNLALAFAKEGAAVAVADTLGERVEGVAEELKSAGARAVALIGDITKLADCERWVAKVVERFGRLDVLVNNAGIGGPVGPVAEIDVDGWQQTLMVNLTGAMLCSRAALAEMLLRRSGSIVNVASNVGKRGLALRSPYVVSKWGMLGLTQTLALEVAQTGIRVNAVCPGPIRGERVDGYIRKQAQALGVTEEAVRQQWISEVPMRRMIEPDEVSEVVLFLASGRASAMTGQAINITAGQVMY